jgi:hypothetical protein
MIPASIGRAGLAGAIDQWVGGRAMLALAVILLFATAAYNTRWMTGISDDWFFYHTAFFGADAEAAGVLRAEAARHLAALGMPAYEISDFAAKTATLSNYLSKTLGIFAAKHLFADVGAGDYGYQVFKSVLGGALLNLALIAGITAAVFRAIGRRDVVVALLLSVVALFFCEYLLFPAVLNWRLSEIPTFGGFVLASLNFFVNPSLHFSPFGFTGRSFFVALMFGFFALRWSDRIAASYLFLVALALVHQTYAGILLALIVATDLAIRPWVFRRPAVVPTVLLGIVLAALRQGLHHGVGTAGTWDIGSLPMLAGLAVALAIMAAGLVLLRPVLTRYYGFTRTLCGQSEVLPDVVALALAALAIGTVSWIMTQHIGVDAAKLSWSELSGRPLSFLRIGIVFGMALMAVRRLGTAAMRCGWRSSAWPASAAWWRSAPSRPGQLLNPLTPPPTSPTTTLDSNASCAPTARNHRPRRSWPATPWSGTPSTARWTAMTPRSNASWRPWSDRGIGIIAENEDSLKAIAEL